MDINRQIISDEEISEQLKNNKDLRDEVTKSITEYRIKNLYHTRTLIKNFVFLSSAVIGFTLPVVGDSSLVKTQFILKGGLLYFLIVVLYGLYYLMMVLEKDKKGLKEQMNEYSDYLEKSKNNIIEYVRSSREGEDFQKKLDQDSELAKDLIEKNKAGKDPNDYSVKIIFLAFTLGLVCILLSMTINI